MNHYTLTIRVPVRAVDDAQAREIAKAILTSATVPAIVDTGTSEIKLQKLQDGKPPRKVKL